MEKLQIKKKGVMGLDTAKAFVIGLLTLVLVGVLSMIVLVQLGNTSLITADTNAGVITNETGAYINATDYTLALAGATSFASPVITAAFNSTDNSSIGTGNITVSDAGVITNATVTNWADVSISYTYTYETTSNTQAVISNGTSGLSSFFSNVTVWLSLLGVVIIILIIAAVVAVVNRFGNTASGNGSQVSV